MNHASYACVLDVAITAPHRIAFQVPAGSVCKLIVSSRDRKNELLSLLTGLAPPAAGSVQLLGEDLYAQDESQRIAVFRRVGVVPEDGGLISNLKMWENILLPSAYHHAHRVEDVEPRVVALFNDLYPDRRDLRSIMGKLPDQLSLRERRLTALVRAFLMEPDLVIYDFVLAGMDREAAARIVAATSEFQAQHRDRTSIYLCTDEGAYARVQADQTIELEH
ncbi:MAG: ATP-binding cassette domain-containing protein [Pseudomonadota bacterium]|nr:MAG: ATP-binding cassette domain-containing protein [Pseudomonadota bacterium]